MDFKPDGRRYSRVTRRSATIIRHLRMGRTFTINEVAAELQARDLPEFYIKRFDRQMSMPRTRAYIKYLITLGAIVEEGDGYTRQFRHQTSDGQWAQALSDLALQHLARLLGQSPEEVPAFLEELLAGYYEQQRLPTLGSIAADVGIGRGRALELFKWTIYMYLDGETCDFDLRAYPVLLKRADRD